MYIVPKHLLLIFITLIFIVSMFIFCWFEILFFMNFCMYSLLFSSFCISNTNLPWLGAFLQKFCCFFIFKIFKTLFLFLGYYKEDASILVQFFIIIFVKINTMGTLSFSSKFSTQFSHTPYHLVDDVETFCTY